MVSREKSGFAISVAASLFYPVTFFMGRRVYRHADRIPATGAALLVCNHISHLDPIVDAVFVHRQRRIPRFLAKESVTKIPIIGRIFLRSGGIPVYRGTAQAGDSLTAAHQALQDGKVVVIYPEGTITKDPQGWPKNAFTGAARLALENDVPIIPIARWGTSDIMNAYSKKFRPLPRKTITHFVGEPLDLTGYRSRPSRNSAVLRETTDFIMTEITALLAEIRQQTPPDRDHPDMDHPDRNGTASR